MDGWPADQSSPFTNAVWWRHWSHSDKHSRKPRWVPKLLSPRSSLLLGSSLFLHMCWQITSWVISFLVMCNSTSKFQPFWSRHKREWHLPACVCIEQFREPRLGHRCDIAIGVVHVICFCTLHMAAVRVKRKVVGNLDWLSKANKGCFTCQSRLKAQEGNISWQITIGMKNKKGMALCL